MYKELKKFKNSGSFLFTTADDLEHVASIPENISGVFLVFDVKSEEEKELIMVGSSGTIQNDGTLKIKSGGLHDKIINGQQFAKTSRKYSWPAQMIKEEITTLEIVWYETYGGKIKYIPTFIEALVLQNFLTDHGKLPRWNVAF